MVTLKNFLLGMASFSLVLSVKLPKHIPGKGTRLSEIKIGAKLELPIPPLPEYYHTSGINYTTRLDSRALLKRDGQLVGRKDYWCDDGGCYLWWDIYVSDKNGFVFSLALLTSPPDCPTRSGISSKFEH